VPLADALTTGLSAAQVAFAVLPSGGATDDLRAPAAIAG
jgi:hypothetical protein